MDDCDHASIYNNLYLDVAIRHRAKPGINETGESSDKCLECGEVIPEARREAMPGCTLCIECQTELEAEN